MSLTLVKMMRFSSKHKKQVVLHSFYIEIYFSADRNRCKNSVTLCTKTLFRKKQNVFESFFFIFFGNPENFLEIPPKIAFFRRFVFWIFHLKTSSKYSFKGCTITRRSTAENKTASIHPLISDCVFTAFCGTIMLPSRIALEVCGKVSRSSAVQIHCNWMWFTQWTNKTNK